MNGEARLCVTLPGFGPGPSAFLALGFGICALLLMGAIYDRPHPFQDNPVALVSMACTSLSFLGLYLGRRPREVLEFLLGPEALTIRTWRLGILLRREHLMSETVLPSASFRYLESQHGVILKGTGFHRDLILPKHQSSELIDWLQGNGIRRFSLDEVRA